jgi:hypothetical protein
LHQENHQHSSEAPDDDIYVISQSKSGTAEVRLGAKSNAPTKRTTTPSGSPNKQRSSKNSLGNYDLTLSPRTSPEKNNRLSGRLKNQDNGKSASHHESFRNLK